MTSVTQVSLTVVEPLDVLVLYEWHSSSKVGKRWESNLLLSTAIDTCGLMLTQAQQFLGQLGVPHPSRQALFKTQRKIIIPVVNKLAALELAAVVQETNAKPSAKVQIDEQHSRPHLASPVGCTSMAALITKRRIFKRSFHVQ